MENLRLLVIVELMLILILSSFIFFNFDKLKKQEYEYVSIKGTIKNIDLSQFKEGQLLAVGDSGGLVLATPIMDYDRIIGIVAKSLDTSIVIKRFPKEIRDKYGYQYYRILRDGSPQYSLDGINWFSYE